jgi:hypothetical protein
VFFPKYVEASPLLVLLLMAQSITPSRIASNFEDVHLTKEEMENIDRLEKGERYCSPPWGVTVFVSRSQMILIPANEMQHDDDEP